MTKWKSGDVVRLLSGGPAMTVIGQADGGVGPITGHVDCMWFDATGQPQKHPFNEAVLAKASADDSGKKRGPRK